RGGVCLPGAARRSHHRGRRRCAAGDGARAVLAEPGRNPRGQPDGTPPLAARRDPAADLRWFLRASRGVGRERLGGATAGRGRCPGLLVRSEAPLHVLRPQRVVHGVAQHAPDRFYQESVDLARRHQLLDFFVVDNILDMAYIDSVLARLAESGYDVRLQYEIKSNLRREHFQRLAEAGAVYVQPGIENLSTHVLRLMDKGVTGCQNVRALRDAESAG